MSSTLSVQQAADLLGISKNTADRWLTSGSFPVPVTKVERTWIIPTRPVLEIIGYSPEEVDATIQDTLAAA